MTQQSLIPARASARIFDAVVLFAAYAIARASLRHTFSAPNLGWRPTELASIALNYARDGFHLFYPQIQWRGSGPGYVEMEFPLQPFLTGVLFRLFGEHEALCLVVPLVCGFAQVWVVYLFGELLFGRVAALVAAGIVAVAPTYVLLTAWGMWPDPPMELCGTLGLYLIARWSQRDQLRDLVLGAASMALAILFKLTALYFGAAILYVFWQKYRGSLWKQRALWFSGLAMLAPAVLWYWHARNLYLETGNTFGILGAGYSKFGSWALLRDLSLLRVAIYRIFFYHLMPFGALAASYGVFEAVRRRSLLPLVWLGSVAIYVLLVWRGVRDGHYQYLLPVMPIGALLAGLGVQSVLERTARSPHLRTGTAVALGSLFAASAVFASSDWFYVRDRGHDTAMWHQKEATGRRIRSLTPPGSLIVVSDTAMDSETPATSMTPPDVFYFADRRGWYQSAAWLSVAKIERLRAQGAAYFVVSAQSAQEFKTKRPELMDYLARNYPKLVDDGDGLVFSLARS
jgi:4-amino-4-deoxy-L-arabinose transferase-like glycosyltransferase